MGYYCEVSFVLEHNDAEELLHSYRERFNRNLAEDFSLVLGNAFEYQGTDYWYHGFKDVRWYNDDPKVKFIENFIKGRSYYELIIIGEDGAYEVFRSEDENQQYLIEPRVTVLRNWHDPNLEFNKRGEDV